MAMGGCHEEARGNPDSPRTLGGKSCAGGDAYAAAHDGVRAQVASRRIGNVHRSALAFAVACFFAQKFGKHAIRRCPLGQAMSVTAMSAGDVAIDAQRFANTNSNSLLAAVEMRQSGHKRAGVELVYLLFNEADTDHLPVCAQPFGFFSSLGRP